MITAIIAISLILLLLLAIIFTCVVVSQNSYSLESRGERGENKVAQILGETVIGQQYVINDLLFCNKSGQSCQIDHVFINKSGIWVIETKNFSGYIFGEENQREWTQVLANGNVKHKFYSPVKQNATHIYHLSKYLNVKNVFQNVVVFLSHADISNVAADNVYLVDELEIIKNKNTDVFLTAQKMEYYYNLLSELKNNATISKEEHIENIHKKQAQIQQGICPRCGGRLVLRNGQRGQFFGCSNYPQCKFTKSIDY